MNKRTKERQRARRWLRRNQDAMKSAKTPHELWNAFVNTLAKLVAKKVIVDFFGSLLNERRTCI
jgi:hypothetical protein